MATDDVFAKALAFTLNHEGKGYVDIPDDRGGPTNSGISTEFLKSIPQDQISHKNIKDLTEEDIASLYKKYFWLAGDISLIAKNHPVLAIKVFDEGVNIGLKEAVKFLQTAFISMYNNKYMVADGVIGPKSAALINMVNATRIYDAFIERMVEHYREIVIHRAVDEEFLKGWENRLHDRPVV